MNDKEVIEYLAGSDARGFQEIVWTALERTNPHYKDAVMNTLSGRWQATRGE